MSEPQKLVYLLSSLETGGAQIGMFRLLSGLSADRFEITVITLQCPEPQLCDRFPAHVNHQNLGINNKIRVDRVRPLLRHLTDADILICSLYHATIVGRLLGQLKSVPTVINWQHNSQFQGPFRHIMYYLTNNFTDVVIADSEAVADNLYDRYGETVNIETVPIAGVDTTRFKPSTTTGGRDVSVGILGSLTEQKNHAQVMKVAERLPDVTFHIGGVGPKREVLDTMVDNKSLTNIHFHGYVNNVPAFLSERDIYFQPSHFEGLCITVIEAMSCGLPVVASEVGGIKNSVKPGETGFLASADETDRFVGYIQKLRENPKMRNQFGRMGRKRVKLKYSTSVLIKRFKSVINTDQLEARNV